MIADCVIAGASCIVSRPIGYYHCPTLLAVHVHMAPPAGIACSLPEPSDHSICCLWHWHREAVQSSCKCCTRWSIHVQARPNWPVICHYDSVFGCQQAVGQHAMPCRHAVPAGQTRPGWQPWLGEVHVELVIHDQSLLFQNERMLTCDMCAPAGGCMLWRGCCVVAVCLVL